MRVSDISKGIIDFGYNSGKMATIIKLGGMLASESRTLNKIVELDEKLVVFKGDILNNPEVVSIISQLNGSGYTVIVNTDAGDEIAPLMRYKNVSVSMFIDIPKEGIENVFRAENLTYLRERDELRFLVKDGKGYEEFCNFQKVKNIRIPYKILEIPSDSYELVKGEVLKGSTTYNTILKIV